MRCTNTRCIFTVLVRTIRGQKKIKEVRTSLVLIQMTTMYSGLSWDARQPINLCIILLTGEREMKTRILAMVREICCQQAQSNLFRGIRLYLIKRELDTAHPAVSSLTSASISACLFSSSLATTMALCLPERLQQTAHSHSNVTTASSSGDI